MIRHVARIILLRRRIMLCLFGALGLFLLMLETRESFGMRPLLSATSDRMGHGVVQDQRRHFFLGTHHYGVNESLKKQELALRFAQRRNRVKEVCSQMNFTKQPGVRNATERFIFPTNSSPVVVFCPVPKTGTTFMKKVFAVANNRRDNVLWTERFNVRPVDDYDEAVMFFFTREPYSRILSAYIDKLWVPNLQFWRGLGREIKEKVRLNTSRRFIKCGHDVTFPEVIKYVIQGLEQGDRVNPHFMPMHTFCEACDYDYDYIGRLETFREDAAYILDAINITSTRGLSDDNDTIQDYITQAYYTIRLDGSRCASKDDVLRRTWRALQLRGLISLQVPFPKPPNTSRVLGKDIFTLMVHQAVAQSAAIFAARDSRTSVSEDQLTSRGIATDKQTVQLNVFSGARAEQRIMALVSAYSLVSFEDRKRVMKLLWSEFELFGYDPQPKNIFSPTMVANKRIFDTESV